MRRKPMPPDFALWAALPMAQTSKIETRIALILDSTRRRGLPRRAMWLAAAVGTAALVPLGMLRPAAQARTVPLAGAGSAQAQTEERERQYVRENSKFLRGQQFSAKEAALQRQQLTVQPNDYTARLCLLGYYLIREIYGKPPTSAQAISTCRQQIFWLIQNHPESLLFARESVGIPSLRASALFKEDKVLWQDQLDAHPSSTVILGNAAEYYLLSDKALAEKYLLRAQALEPNNPDFPNKLGELYRLNGRDPSAFVVAQSAKKALTEYELAATLGSKTSEPVTSAELAKAAFDAGEYDKARQYATALLSRGRTIAEEGKARPGSPAFLFHENDEDIHEADMVLGRLALHSDDVAGAEAYLLAMGRVSGAGTLDSSGPNMQLAADLLKVGRRDAVLAYFDECTKFWKDKQLAVWRSEVEHGKMPNFQGNLRY